MADAVGVGQVSIWGPAGEFVLEDVLHVPDLAGPLFSVKNAVDRGMSVHFDPPVRNGGQHRVQLMSRGTVLLTASQRAGLYFLDTPVYAHVAHSNEAALDQAWMWHRRLGHKGFSTLADLAKQGMLAGCTLTPQQFMQARAERVCQPCVQGKLRRVPHPPRLPRPVRILHRVHMDLCELPLGADEGCRYFATLIDEATRYARVVLLPRKSDTAACVREMIAWCENQTDVRVQRVRHDRGGEYMSGSLRAYYATRGIQMEPTAPYTPESNGVAERHNLTLLDLVVGILTILVLYLCLNKFGAMLSDPTVWFDRVSGLHESGLPGPDLNVV